VSISALVGLVFIVLVVAAGALILIRRAKMAGVASRPLLIGLIGFALMGGLMISVMAWRLVGESRRSELLVTLGADQVAGIVVGDRQLERQHVPSVVRALNACRPLSDEAAHRGLSTGRTTLRVELNSTTPKGAKRNAGEALNMVSRYDPRRDAALLSFETWSGISSSPGSSVGGDMQCPSLPRALAAAGAALPDHTLR
jgi:hypothetical protein